ncbi:MAG: hypothetical protein QNJ70_22455 [Xenococcaceae cyanobacterium MO_207.B15]|nr:hypothetical protein [Xenococcaceae cyanobacterium MO_207.B15]
MTLPLPGMTIDSERTAIVIVDPQNDRERGFLAGSLSRGVDFLSPNGVTWGVVGESVTENNTVANIAALMKAAKDYNLPLFIVTSNK